MSVLSLVTVYMLAELFAVVLTCLYTVEGECQSAFEYTLHALLYHMIIWSLTDN